MKARIPKEYQDLNPRQQERLKEYIADIATRAALKQEEHDCRIILDLYMKMVCCVLHDAFGFGEKRLTSFIGNHRRLFDRQNKLVQKGQQMDYLDKRMNEIFKKGGFPQEFIDDLFIKIDLVEMHPRED